MYKTGDVLQIDSKIREKVFHIFRIRDSQPCK